MIASMISEFAVKYVKYVYAAYIEAHLDEIYAEHLNEIKCTTTKELKILKLCEGTRSKRIS